MNEETPNKKLIMNQDVCGRSFPGVEKLRETKTYNTTRVDLYLLKFYIQCLADLGEYVKDQWELYKNTSNFPDVPKKSKSQTKHNESLQKLTLVEKSLGLTPRLCFLVRRVQQF